MKKPIFAIVAILAVFVTLFEVAPRDSAVEFTADVYETELVEEDAVLSEVPGETDVPVPIETETEAAPETEVPIEEPVVEGVWKNLGTFTLTAYCACEKCCGSYALNRPLDENGDPIVYTSIGAVAKAGITVAVDPRMIPYNSYIRINDHTYVAQDTGGGVNGYHIDIYFDNHQDALNFGVQYAEVEVLL